MQTMNEDLLLDPETEETPKDNRGFFGLMGGFLTAMARGFGLGRWPAGGMGVRDGSALV